MAAKTPALPAKPSLLIRCSRKPTPRQKKLIDILAKLGVTIEYADLEVRAFEIPPRGYCLQITSPDLASVQKREDVKRQISSHFQSNPTSVIILEGFSRWGQENREFLQVCFGNLFLAKLEMAAPIMIPTRNPRETAEIIERLVIREQAEDLPPTLSRVRAKTVDLASAQEFMVAGLLHCGEKKAKMLLKEFDSPYNIFQTILNEPQKIEGLKGFGPKFLEANQQMLGEYLTSNNLLKLK